MRAVCPILGRETEVKETPFSKDEWKVVQCQETGFVFLANPPVYDRLETEFAWERTFSEESRSRDLEEPALRRASKLANRLSHILFPSRNRFFELAAWSVRKDTAHEPIRILDIGCGSGSLMHKMKDRFAEIGREIIPVGIEVSQELARISNESFEQLGGHVVADNAIDGSAKLEAKSLDVVIMSSFLEHEAQPLELLKRLHNAIDDGGSIVLKVPNYGCWNRPIRGAKWCGFRYPDHVSYFTPQTLERLAHEAGFQVSRQGFLDKLPTADTMYAVLERKAADEHAGRIREAA